MDKWDQDSVVARLQEAVDTARRMPSAKVIGYYNLWPTMVREPWEAMADQDYRRPPPGPKAIERMEETMRWMLWLEVEQRHLVWMRAKNYEWKDICRRFGCNRTTAWRWWTKAVGTIVEQLNQRQSEGVASCSKLS
ncbi:DUF6362 family protein [Chitinibacter sp. GC72]|uniref:DUF6362 family protein n=1 Tax=Chitinibacter sp. GC72 TaxID=1526917 RepID=UPI0018DFF21E|nr:DUF6362 family protein [Chitinibacter sp. GC72]